MRENIPFECEALTEAGLQMSTYIGALTVENNGNRVPVTSENWTEAHTQLFTDLVELGQAVPYETIVAEDGRLQAIQEEKLNVQEALRAKIAAEHAKLDSFADRIGGQKAEELAKRKKAEVQAEIEAEITANQATLEAVRIEAEQFNQATESFTTPWPLPPADVRAKITAKYTFRSNRSEADTEAFGNRTAAEPLGELEILAAQIPDLSSRLQGAVSEHGHKYDEIKTVYETLQEARSKPEEERTQEEDALMRAILVMNIKFMQSSFQRSYEQVYSAGEFIDLRDKLLQFSRVDRSQRPDFKELEGQILDIASQKFRFGERGVPPDIRGARERMQNDAEGRRGLTWVKLVTYAERASDYLRNYMGVNAGLDNDRRRYLIDVVDKTGKTPDLSWVYQFIADYHAYTMLSDRRIIARAGSKDHFVENCTVIEEWLKEANPILEQIPKELRLPRHLKKGPPRGREARRTERHQVGAVFQIRSMVDDILARRDGDAGSGRRKSVDFNIMAALRHQLLLGYIVDTLKTELPSYVADQSEEIIPLDE